MFDNQLFSKIISVLNAGFIAQGYSGDTAVLVKQGYQPTNQGVNTARTCYLHKLGDNRLGYVSRETSWVPDSETGGQMVHTEKQWYETLFQVDALATQDPQDVQSLTASDIVNIAAGILQSDFAIQSFRDSGVGILRISQVRNPYFMDDRNRFEAAPSFDFTLEHEQVIVSEALSAEIVEVNIQRV